MNPPAIDLPTATGIEVTVSVRAVAEAGLLGLLAGHLAVRHGAGPLGAVLAALSALAVTAGSVAAHELAHAVVASRYGLAVVAVHVRAAVGADIEREATSDPRAQLRICLAGPAVTVALLVVGLALALLGSGAGAAAGLVLTVANLAALAGSVVPLDRSDVGRALVAARHLHSWTGIRGQAHNSMTRGTRRG